MYLLSAVFSSKDWISKVDTDLIQSATEQAAQTIHLRTSAYLKGFALSAIVT